MRYDGTHVVRLGMASMSVKASGIDAAQKKAQLLEKKIRGPALRGAMRAMLRVYRKGLIARLPTKRSGKLRRSIRLSARFTAAHRITGKLSVGGRRSPAFYAYFLDKGTGVFGIKHRTFNVEPRRKQAIFWPGAAHPFARATVKGIRPRRFMELTARAEAAPAAREFDREFHRLIGKPFA